MDKNGIDPENKSSSSDNNFGIIDNTKEKQADSECCQCEVLTTEQIVQDMTDCINDVNVFVNFPRITIRKLLNHFKWDKVELLEKYFHRNKTTFFSQAKITNPYNISTHGMVPDSKNSEKVECEICTTLYLINSMIGLECGHRFCTQCWSEYLKMKIIKDGRAQFIECPAYSCNILIDDMAVINLITNSKVKVKYQILITNDFVACNKLLRWCPSANCTYAIKVSFVDDTLPVVCKCSHRFCFACGESWHDAIKCQLLKNWIRKCGDQNYQESSNWITENTKECPNCNTKIEKNGGCNIMICRNQNCHYEFCWICRAPRSLSRPHLCNRNDGQELCVAGSGQSKDKSSEVTRFLHHYNHYMNHMQSLKLEKNLYGLVKNKEEQMDDYIFNAAQVLTPVADKLFKCRQTLMYTYAFTYYLEQNNQSLIFEENQNDLETATEILSGYMERELTKEDFSYFSGEVHSKSRYCERRREILLDHIREGYEKGFWDIDV